MAVDPASDIINTFVLAMRACFNPGSAQVAIGGGSADVRFFAGDGGLPSSLIPQGDDCEQPLLWVRAAHRYRFRPGAFPAAYVGDGACKDSLRALAVEVGVGRCSTMEAEPDWDTLASEAEISLDDSWRIELALCMASGELRTPKRAVATDTVAPFGPEGGIIAWTGMAYVQF
jgi:hypothetical protein